MQHATRPYLGFGLGLRTDHYQTIIEEKPQDIEWFEIISENFMVEGGKPLANLDKIRADYPIVMHGVSLSIAGNHDIDYAYLDKLKTLANRVQPAWISDHLAWTRGNAHNYHDLLPVPYTKDSLNHIVNRIDCVQNYLGQTMAFENPSTYVSFTQSTFSEYDFLNEMCQRSGCTLLLDINNIFVSCENHGWSTQDYINGIHPENIWQHHLAGHTYSYAGKIIIDTHDMPVRDEVWDLYADAVQHFGQVSTMIERDDNIPELSELIDEINHARSIQKQVMEKNND